MIRVYPLTTYQEEEVRGLLAVCQDEAATSGDRQPWGTIEPARSFRVQNWRLVVHDHADAVDDLRHRADYLVDEGYRVGGGLTGQSGARSLRQLADRIESGQ